MIGITNAVNKKASEVEMVNLTLKTDQSSHTVLNGVNFTLSYGNYTKSYTWNGSTITIEVPAYVTYTITFGGVTNYTTPASITYTAQTGNSRTVNAVYTIQKETVTVKCSGLSSGFTLTVKNADTGATIGSQTTTSKSYQIPAGTKYYVTASTVSGYNKPANSSTYTAVANGTRTVTMTYTALHTGTKNPTNGVWIQDTDGYCHTINAWSGEYTPNGVAVITDNCSFVIALEAAYDSYARWAPVQKGNYLVSGITTTSSETEANVDYDGEAQTEVIVNVFKDASTASPFAAKLCDSYIFPNGKKGYLGALGEWKTVGDNLSDVGEALNLLGSETYTIVMVSNTYIWTSTQYNAEEAWMFHRSGIAYADKTANESVVAFTSL